MPAILLAFGDLRDRLLTRDWEGKGKADECRASQDTKSTYI
jgi:hypothetical protein